jgi:Zn-dependent peptidase ImmA (M78 family)
MLYSVMAHELMHTFLYDTDRLPPVKLGITPSEKFLRMEEELIYYLRREFLMPTFSIKNILPSIREPSIENICFLRSHYRVSSDIVAYRLIFDLNIWDAIFIKFRQERSVYKPLTKIKNKSNPLYKEIKIPPFLPVTFYNELFNKLSIHINETVKNGVSKDIVEFAGNKLKIESKKESKKPVTIIMLITINKPITKLTNM